eukprot:SM000043S15875  [mRNA]  locus=s43:728108:730723:+ [translate_table: standard]
MRRGAIAADARAPCGSPARPGGMGLRTRPAQRQYRHGLRWWETPLHSAADGSAADYIVLSPDGDAEKPPRVPASETHSVNWAPPPPPPPPLACGDAAELRRHSSWPEDREEDGSQGADAGGAERQAWRPAAAVPCSPPGGAESPDLYVLPNPPPTRVFRRLRKGQAAAATTTACNSSPAPHSRLSQPAGGVEDAGGCGRRRLSLSVSGSLGSKWPPAVLSTSDSLDEEDIEEASSHDMSPLVDTGMRTPCLLVKRAGNMRCTGGPGQLSANPPAVPFTSADLQRAGEGPDAEHDDDWSRAFHDMDDLQRCHGRGAPAMPQDKEDLSAIVMARLPHFRSVDQLAMEGDGSGEPVYVDYLSQFVNAPTSTPRRRATTPARADLRAAGRGGATDPAPRPSKNKGRWSSRRGRKVYCKGSQQLKGRAAYIQHKKDTAKRAATGASTSRNVGGHRKRRRSGCRGVSK